MRAHPWAGAGPALLAAGALAALSLLALAAPGRVAASATTVPTPPASARVAAIVATSVGLRALPAHLVPPLAQAFGDEAVPLVDGCFDSFKDSVVHPCNYGDLAGKQTVVLYGDSHAMMWFPALEQIAVDHGWHLVALAKATCPPVQVPVFSPDLGHWYRQCARWKRAALARIRALHPGLVVVGASREYGVPNDHVLVYGVRWIAGLVRTVRLLRADGAAVVVLGPVPYPTGVVSDCLAVHRHDVGACDVPDQVVAGVEGYNAAGVAGETAAVHAAGAAYLDVSPWFCARGACAVVVGDRLVYRDDNHLTATYAGWLAAALAAELSQLASGFFHAAA